MTLKNQLNRKGGFTLMETVIAIGVLAVLLTAFLAVFAPAAQGIRKAISAQEADRLAYTLERELVTLRANDAGTYPTGFDKAYDWIESAANPDQALLIYQYRGNPDTLRPQDGTMEPFTGEGVAGQDFIVQPIVRRSDSPLLEQDLRALEGRVYTARLTQLIFQGGQLVENTDGNGNPQPITDPTPDDGDPPGAGAGAQGYPEAYIAFAAQFFAVPNSSYAYIRDRFDPSQLERPIFTRNLAVRR